MTPLEFEQASDALITWLQSQDIAPADSVPVLLSVAGAIIHSLAEAQGRNKAQGVKAALDMLKGAAGV